MAHPQPITPKPATFKVVAREVLRDRVPGSDRTRTDWTGKSNVAWTTVRLEGGYVGYFIVQRAHGARMTGELAFARGVHVPGQFGPVQQRKEPFGARERIGKLTGQGDVWFPCSEQAATLKTELGELVDLLVRHSDAYFRRCREQAERALQGGAHGDDAHAAEAGARAGRHASPGAAHATHTWRTRVSLGFVAMYLGVTGLGLLVAPQAALRLMGSTADYGATMPRWVGMFSVALAAVIVQVLRHRLTVLYPLGFFMPGAMLFGFAALFVQSGDALFLVVAGVVSVGVAITGASLWLDRWRAAGHAPTPREAPYDHGPA